MHNMKKNCTKCPNAIALRKELEEVQSRIGEPDFEDGPEFEGWADRSGEKEERELTNEVINKLFFKTGQNWSPYAWRIKFANMIQSYLKGEIDV